MLIEVLKAIAIFFYWTWFIWPFVFVFTMVYSITSHLKDETASMKPLIVASISLLIMLCGIVAPIFAV